MSNMNLINGDCLEELKQIPDNSVELIITSPPYFNAREYSQWSSYAEYMGDMKKVFSYCFNKLREGRFICVNISVVIQARKSRSHESLRIPIPFHLLSVMEEIGYKFLEDIIWVKPEGASKNRNGGFYQHRQPVAYKPNIVNEYILVFQKPSTKLIDNIVRSYKGDVKDKSLVSDGYERSNVWCINPETNINHPAPFPTGLSDRLINYYSYIGDTVLDPFMGSGTTGVSCKNLNRNFIGIELDEHYYDIAKARIENAEVSENEEEKRSRDGDEG